MKFKLLLLLILLLVLSSLNAQINFEKGYFINNNGDKIECLIKNEGWRSNPDVINYKLSEGENVKSFNLDNAKEFRIYGSSKFIRQTVRIDLSSLKLKDLTVNQDPEYKNKTLFLRVLVEGKANLYSFQENDKIKYFYSIDNSNIVQLINHFYLMNSFSSVVIKKASYKNQLKRHLSCENNSPENLEYKYPDLIEYFINFNKCSKSNISYKEKERKGKVNLYANIGVEFSQMEIIAGGGFNRIVTEFDNFNVPTFGVELEYILPFRNNKWGSFISTMYRKFEIEGNRKLSTLTSNKIKLNYQSIEIKLGVRHYFFINDNTSIFIEGAPNFSLVVGDRKESLINIYNETNQIPSDTPIEPYELNFTLGGGIKFKKAYIKVNYFTNNDIFDKDMSIYSNYAKFALSAGYNIL